MRHLALTSPEMRGKDIQQLQKILNERLEHYKSRTRIKENGIYDRETVHAVANIAYVEGLFHYDGSPAVIHLIEHPHFRNPIELKAEHDRRLLREHHNTVAGSTQGIARIPIIAAHYIGVRENPAESNWGYPYPADWEKHFGFDSGVSWCGCFSGSMVLAAGGHVSSRVAFCPYIEADARSQTDGFDLWRPNHNEGIEPGWLVLYNWEGGSEPEHVGVVESIHSDHLVAIEGNTNGYGGSVAREERPYNFVVGYARPRL